MKNGRSLLGRAVLIAGVTYHSQRAFGVGGCGELSGEHERVDEFGLARRSNAVEDSDNAAGGEHDLLLVDPEQVDVEPAAEDAGLFLGIETGFDTGAAIVRLYRAILDGEVQSVDIGDFADVEAQTLGIETVAEEEGEAQRLAGVISMGLVHDVSERTGLIGGVSPCRMK
ncbi:MAG: hypothetical protein ACEQSB_01175 [Undibacterium sp.]